MDWKYRVKRMLGDRFGLSAALFLLVTLLGTLSAFFGCFRGPDCAGYLRPFSIRMIDKDDPALPRRTAQAPLSALDGPGKGEPWPELWADRTAAAEQAVTDALTRDHFLIQLYGGYQRLAGRTVVEDPAGSTVVRLENGQLTFLGYGTPDTSAQVADLKRFQRALEERNISMLYVHTPSKLGPGMSLPAGMEDNSNACADDLLAALEEAGVDCLDMRETLLEATWEWKDYFYDTDHHWTPLGAFLGFQALAERLEDYYYSVPISQGVRRQPIRLDPRCTDPESYEATVLPRFFLGSQGKRVGSLYGGVDDFVLVRPTFPTLLHYDASIGGINGYGSAEESVLVSKRVETRDWFGGNPYTYYSGGDYSATRTYNYYNPQGPKVLLLRDSMACALTPYLAYACGEVITVDPRHFHSDYLSYIDWVDPDVVVVLASGGNARSDTSFRYLPQPAQPGKRDSLRWLETAHP